MTLKSACWMKIIHDEWETCTWWRLYELWWEVLRGHRNIFFMIYGNVVHALYSDSPFLLWSEDTINVIQWLNYYETLVNILVWPLKQILFACLGVTLWILKILSHGMSQIIVLQIPHLRPAEYKRSRLPRNCRTINRLYGGCPV